MCQTDACLKQPIKQYACNQDGNYMSFTTRKPVFRDLGTVELKPASDSCSEKKINTDIKELYYLVKQIDTHQCLCCSYNKGRFSYDKAKNMQYCMMC